MSIINNQLIAKFYYKPVLWTGAYCLLTTGGAMIDSIRQYTSKNKNAISKNKNAISKNKNVLLRSPVLTSPPKSKIMGGE